MKKIYILLLLLPLSSLAQENSQYGEKLNKDESLMLNRGDYNRIISRYFSKLVGSKNNADIMGNYASLDAADGAFQFNTTMEITGKDSTKFNYLSIGIKSDLINDNYAALFSNSKLNNNTSVQVSYNFKVGKSVVSNSTSDRIYYKVRDSLSKVRNLYLAEQQTVDREVVNDLLNLKNEQKAYISKRLSEIDNQITNNYSLLDNASTDTLKKYLSAVEKLIKEKDSLSKAQTALKVEIDSLSLTQTQWGDLSRRERNIYRIKNKNEANKLFDELKLNTLSLQWITLVAEGGNKRYYTFTPTSHFDQQLVRDNLITYRLGALFNYYKMDNMMNRFFFINGGIDLSRDNNTALLDTEEITQEAVYKNDAENTSRKVVTKYKAFTDPIEESLRLNMVANAYWLSGKNSNGFHLFSSFHKPFDMTGYFNCGVGYLMSLTNVKKDSPIINAEVYVKINDVFNQLGTEDNFVNRNEVGVRFGLPFNLFLK